MSNLFYYTRKEILEPKAGDTEVKFEFIKSSLNVNKIIHTAEMPDGRLAIIMDDYHDRIAEDPIKNKKGEIVGSKNRHYTHQSILYLQPEDVERFVDATVIAVMTKGITIEEAIKQSKHLKSKV
jgi:hypothetical protein